MLALSHLLNKKAKILGFKLTSVPSHYFAYSQSHISNIVNNKSRLRPIKSPTIPRIVPLKGLTRSVIENIKTVKNALIVGLSISAKNVAEISFEKSCIKQNHKTQILYQPQ